jgi:hypothetical protein
MAAAGSSIPRQIARMVAMSLRIALLRYFCQSRMSRVYSLNPNQPDLGQFQRRRIC